MESRVALVLTCAALSAILPKPSAASAPITTSQTASTMSRTQAPQIHAAAVQRANALALDVYRAAAANKADNIALSPLGIEAAMVAMNAGARGATAEEINALVRAPGGAGPATQDVFDAYTDVLTPGHRNGSYTLELSTRIWAAQMASIEPTYAASCARLHCDAPTTVDFRQADAVARNVNEWIAAKTNHRIEKLIDARAIDPRMLLLLGNAVYFKADWNSKFLPERTEQANFFVDAKTTARVPMMHSATETFGYASFPDCEVVQMMYAQPSNLTMVVVLPKPNVAVAAVEQKLTGATWDEWMAGLRGRQVDLFLPRFKAESHLSLGQTLSTLGMKRAFTGDSDFTGLSKTPGVFFSDVVHGATVEVDEHGTVAAAATITPFVTAAPGERETPVVFRADRPFLFAIRDRRTGALMFLGRVTKP